MITETSVGHSDNSIHINFEVNNIWYLIAASVPAPGQIQICGGIPSALLEDPSDFVVNQFGNINIDVTFNKPLSVYTEIYDYITTHDNLPSVVINIVDSLSNLEGLCDAGFRATLFKNANF